MGKRTKRREWYNEENWRGKLGGPIDWVATGRERTGGYLTGKPKKPGGPEGKHFNLRGSGG